MGQNRGHAYRGQRIDKIVDEIVVRNGSSRVMGRMLTGPRKPADVAGSASTTARGNQNSRRQHLTRHGINKSGEPEQPP